MVHNQEAVSRPINCIHHTNWPQSSSLCSGMNSWRTFIIGKESEWVMKLSHKWYQGITETYRTPVSGRVSSPKYAASSTDPKLVLFSWGDHWPCSMKDWGVESLQTQSKFDTHLKTAKYASMASLIICHFEERLCSMGQCTGRFWAKSAEIQVFPSSTGYMLVPFEFPLLVQGVFNRFF